MESDERFPEDRDASGAGGAASSGASFECNICFEVASDAVVSLCGHLFCWPCIHQWLEMGPHRQTCPVCKAAVSRDKLVPLYGRGSDSNSDPRDKVPPRPSGQRTEPPPENNFYGGWGHPGAGGGGGANGFHMSFGVGAFPFGFFSSTFNVGGGDFAAGQQRGGGEDQEVLSKMFLIIALVFIFWMIMV